MILWLMGPAHQCANHLVTVEHPCMRHFTMFRGILKWWFQGLRKPLIFFFFHTRVPSRGLQCSLHARASSSGQQGDQQGGFCSRALASGWQGGWKGGLHSRVPSRSQHHGWQEGFCSRAPSRGQLGGLHSCTCSFAWLRRWLCHSASWFQEKEIFAPPPDFREEEIFFSHPGFKDEVNLLSYCGEEILPAPLGFEDGGDDAITLPAKPCGSDILMPESLPDSLTMPEPMPNPMSMFELHSQTPVPRMHCRSMHTPLFHIPAHYKLLICGLTHMALKFVKY